MCVKFEVLMLKQEGFSFAGVGKGFLDVDALEFWWVWFSANILAYFEELQMGNILSFKVKKMYAQ